MVVREFNFSYRRKKCKIKVKECRTLISQVHGLMFRRNSLPLLFVFKSPRLEPIHSFFCRKFVAIWFLDNKIIDVKLVKPWRISVRPNEEFDKILEIPSNCREYSEFVDG